MIPKIIHYCWFGQKDKPKLVNKCIASWHKYCPDYKILEWSEENVDLDEYPYLRWCYNNEKWAFVSDFARLLIVQKHGGLYFDTDVELIRNPDHLLVYESFFGFENSDYVATGLGFGSEANHPVLQVMINQYTQLRQKDDGSFSLIGCPIMNTLSLESLGLLKNGAFQTIQGASILPADFLNPYEDATGRMFKTENTISIHWYGKSWLSKGSIIRSRITRPLHRLFGIECFNWLKKNTPT